MTRHCKYGENHYLGRGENSKETHLTSWTARRIAASLTCLELSRILVPMNWGRMRESIKRTSQTEAPKSSRLATVVSMVWLSALSGVLIAAMLIPASAFMITTTRSLSTDLVDLPLEVQEIPNPQTTRVLASNGKRIAYFFQENRQDIRLKDISPEMQEALISIEDNRFHSHGALDLKGTMRALLSNASSSTGTQGGSTLTQQLVKLTLLQQAITKEQQDAAKEKSVERKIRELKIAIEFEERLSKDEILERYLNIAYFGDGAYGIDAASNHFFSVKPSELSVSQAATLAGLVQNPDTTNPRVYPERALQRRNVVLGVMAKLGKIDRAEAEKLSAEPLGLKFMKFPNGCVNSQASFSCDYVRRFLLADEDLGETVAQRQALLERGGLTVKSNIDLSMQSAVNKAVKQHVLPKDKAIGALALVEPGTGKVRALGQSRPMGNSKKGETYINYTVPRKYGDSGGFQAGSTFKMFTVAAALEEGIPASKSYNSPSGLTLRAGTYFDCDDGATGEFTVRNSTGAGYFNMTQATRRSVNSYFAQLQRDAGLCETVEMAESMGIDVPFKDEKGRAVPGNGQVPSFTLGPIDVSPLDMAAAYAVPAAGGIYCEPSPVDELLDESGRLIKKYEPECKRVMTEKNAGIVNEILAGLQRPGGFGHSRGSGLSVPSAAKTGTTSGSKAVWYVGYTPEISTASMIAGVNNKGVPSSLSGISLGGRPINFGPSGSSLAAPQWKSAMGIIEKNLAPVKFLSVAVPAPRPTARKPKPTSTPSATQPTPSPTQPTRRPSPPRPRR